MKTYEWAVVGSGIAGISIAEILTREGHSVVLILNNTLLKFLFASGSLVHLVVAAIAQQKKSPACWFLQVLLVSL